MIFNVAVYFNLAIDCDQDEKSAEQLTSVFEDIVISTERFGELICDSYCTLPNFFWSTGLGGAPSDYAGDWYKVCVCPREMSMPQDHPGILDEQNMNHVRSKLYQHLRRGLDLGHQFRAQHLAGKFKTSSGTLIGWENLNRSTKLANSLVGWKV